MIFGKPNSSDLVKFKVYDFIAETDKAILLYMDTREPYFGGEDIAFDTMVWLPKSQATYKFGAVTMPRWLAEKKHLDWSRCLGEHLT